MNPSQDQWLAQLRQVLPGLGWIAITLGWMTKDQVSEITALILQIAGPAIVAGSAAWALYANTRKSIMTSAAKPSAEGVPAPTIVLPQEEKELASQLPNNVSVEPKK